jgi:hypothetical protein
VHVQPRLNTDSVHSHAQRLEDQPPQQSVETFPTGDFQQPTQHVELKRISAGGSRPPPQPRVTGLGGSAGLTDLTPCHS